MFEIFIRRDRSEIHLKTSTTFFKKGKYSCLNFTDGTISLKVITVSFLEKTKSLQDDVVIEYN